MVNGNRTDDYAYDKMGNRLAKTDTISTGTTTTGYEYDANDRLVDEKTNGQISTVYTYDNNGNTLSKKDATSETDSVWNQENRLIAATVKTAQGVVQQQLQYRYNNAGIRTASIVNGQETRYLLDEVQPYTEVLEEYTMFGTKGVSEVSYVYGNRLISETQSGATAYYLVDGLGSTTELTDASGVVVSRSRYDAFGNSVQNTGAISNKYQFAGEQFDQNLGDYYLRQRYYDATAGRFTRRDSYLGQIQDPATLHKYVYGGDNPISGTDPTGLETMSDVLSGLNLLDQLAARLYPVAINPAVLDTARALAIIFSVATVSYLVTEEVNKQGNVGLRVLPDEEAKRRRKKEPKAPPEENDVNQMRLQLQDAPGHTFGIPIENVPEVGVTVSQVGQAVLSLWQYRRTLASWFPQEYDTALIKAMAGVTKRAKELPPFGVFQGNPQVYSRQWNKNDFNGNQPVDRGYYRVDFENLRGHNLRE